MFLGANKYNVTAREEKKPTFGAKIACFTFNSILPQNTQSLFLIVILTHSHFRNYLDQIKMDV